MLSSWTLTHDKSTMRQRLLRFQPCAIFRPEAAPLDDCCFIPRIYASWTSLLAEAGQELRIGLCHRMMWVLHSFDQ